MVRVVDDSIGGVATVDEDGVMILFVQKGLECCSKSIPIDMVESPAVYSFLDFERLDGLKLLLKFTARLLVLHCGTVLFRRVVMYLRHFEYFEVGSQKTKICVRIFDDGFQGSAA